MKKMLLFRLSVLFITFTFLACNHNPKTKSIENNAHQEASTQIRGFPSVKRPRDTVNCRNCYATFKLSRATQKVTHGHRYIECPICHHDYLTKAKDN